MINTYQAAEQSRNGNRVARRKSVPHVKAGSAVPFGSLVLRWTLSVLVFCSTVALVATIANAQEQRVSPSSAAGLSRGWWLPKALQSACTPQLLISTAELTHFEASDRLRTSPAQPTSYLSEPMNSSIVSSRDFGSSIDATVAESGLLADTVSDC
jgi:hypothetical protein